MTTNRRAFLRGAIALSATLPVVVKSDALPTESAPKSPLKTLYVVNNSWKGERLRGALGRPKNTRVIWPGSALCGEGFDRIIMCVGWANGDLARGEKWFRHSVQTRLMPGGTIEWLEADDHARTVHYNDMRSYKIATWDDAPNNSSLRAKTRENLVAWWQSRAEQEINKRLVG